MISRSFVYLCHGNIDFTKICIAQGFVKKVKNYLTKYYTIFENLITINPFFIINKQFRGYCEGFTFSERQLMRSFWRHGMIRIWPHTPTVQSHARNLLRRSLISGNVLSKVISRLNLRGFSPWPRKNPRTIFRQQLTSYSELLTMS